METEISGIKVNLLKKNIKHLYIRILPPDGHVVISAPRSMKREDIEKIFNAKKDWVIESSKMLNHGMTIKRETYREGDIFTVFGKEYSLIFKENIKEKGALIKGENLILFNGRNLTDEKREKLLFDYFKKLLKEKIDELLPEIEDEMGLKCKEYRLRYMKSRWGSCNSTKGKLCFNLQLVQKEEDCIRYVIVHEMAHLKYANHGKSFKKLVETYVPDWEIIDKKLDCLN